MEFGVAYGALTEAGFSGKRALETIDKQRDLTPEQREARGAYFDQHADIGAMMSSLGEAYGAEVADAGGHFSELPPAPEGEGHFETLPYTGGGSVVPLSDAGGGEESDRADRSSVPP